MNENEKKKVSLLDRYIKYWYGISGPLDEYKKAKIDQIGNKAFFIAMLTLGLEYPSSLTMSMERT